MSVFSGFAKWKNNTNPVNLVLLIIGLLTDKAEVVSVYGKIQEIQILLKLFTA